MIEPSRRLVLTTGLLAIAGALVSCGADAAPSAMAAADANASPEWKKILDAATAEGTINVYNTASEAQNARTLAAWKNAYPAINLTLTRGAAELPARVSAELESSTAGADAFLWSDPAWFQRNEKYLADLSSLDSNEGWSSEFWAVPNKAIVATTLPASMVVWNTDSFPNGFKTWDDLLDPSVKGKLGARSGITVSIAGYLDFMETELGDEYLTKLGQQSPKFYGSSVPLMQAVASGELGVSNIGVPATVLDLQSKGAPIEFAYMDPGYGFQHAGAAFAQAAHPNAALVFMNWFMSSEGQTAYNGDGQGGAGREGIEGALDLAGYTMLDSEEYPPAVIPEWEAKFHKWFG